MEKFNASYKSNKNTPQGRKISILIPDTNPMVKRCTYRVLCSIDRWTNICWDCKGIFEASNQPSRKNAPNRMFYWRFKLWIKQYLNKRHPDRSKNMECVDWHVDKFLFRFVVNTFRFFQYLGANGWELLRVLWRKRRLLLLLLHCIMIEFKEESTSKRALQKSIPWRSRFSYLSCIIREIVLSRVILIRD